MFLDWETACFVLFPFPDANIVKKSNHVHQHGEKFAWESIFVSMEEKKRYRKDKEFAQMIAWRLLQLRREQNYTQEYVIDKTHLDIHRYETGNSIPLLMSLTKLCELYGITLDEFFAPLNYPPKK